MKVKMKKIELEVAKELTLEEEIYRVFRSSGGPSCASKFEC